MNRLRARVQPLPTTLVTLCLLLGAVVAWQLRAGLLPEREAAGPALKDPDGLALDALPSPPELANLGSFAEIVERPLFNEDRRQLVSEPVNAQAESPRSDRSVEELALTGIVMAGGHQVAIVKNKRTSEVTRLGEGEAIGEWTVGDLRPDGIVLNKGNERRELPLRLYSAH